MSPDEISMDARDYLAQAVEMIEQIEMRETQAGGPKPAMANTALCFTAEQATELALKAVCAHYNLVIPEDEDLGTMIDMLHPTLIRVPEQVQQARLLHHYKTDAGATGQAEPASGDECPEAAATARNVVGWAQVILRAGKTG